MPVGKPDDGFNPNALSSNQTDIGSGIDRLLMGGGSVFRAGRVIWATGFENGLVTDYDVAFPNGGNSAPHLGGTLTQPNGSILSAWQGSYYHLLFTSGTAFDSASFAKYFPAPLAPGQWGVETMLQIDTLNTQFHIILKKVGPTGIPGSVTYTADVYVEVGASNSSIFLRYIDQNGVGQTLAGLSGIMAIRTNAWYNAKLVTNFRTGKYVRFYWNNFAYDLSNIPMQATAAGVDEKSSTQLIVTALTSTDIARVGIDNVILTADEP